MAKRPRCTEAHLIHSDRPIVITVVDGAENIRAADSRSRGDDRHGVDGYIARSGDPRKKRSIAWTTGGFAII